ncbi:MAG: ABC transporter permease [Chloroflexi bacterium]|nr:ABC transporter permease [Chloroflexota bacterium]
MSEIAAADRGVAGRRARRSLVPFLLLVPVAVLFLSIYLPSIGYGFAQSFWKFAWDKGIIREWNIENYTSFFTVPRNLEILWTTLRVSTISTAFSLIIGYPLAYYIAFRGGRFRGFLILLTIAPLLVTVVIRSMGWLMVLGPGGVINDALLEWGIVREPVKMLFNETAVIIGMTHIHVPYVTIGVLTSLQMMDPALMLASRGLGATPARTFWRIVFPLSLPGVFTGVIISFLLSMTSFATPQIMGGGRVQVIATKIYQEELFLLNFPFGGAIAFILLVIVATITVLSTRFVERGRFREVFQH